MLDFGLMFASRFVEIMVIREVEFLTACIEGRGGDQGFELRGSITKDLFDVDKARVGLADALGEEGLLGIGNHFPSPRALDGGGKRKAGWKEAQTLTREVEMKVISPFCVRDGAPLHKTESFKGLPAES